MARHRDELPPEEAELLGLEFQTEEQEQAEQNEFAEQNELRRVFLQRQMENTMFREWLWDQLTALGTFENSFGYSPAGFTDPMATQFKLGMKAAGWALWETFDNAAPELASLMRREGLKSAS